jgi:hypothetical protein
MSRKRNLPTTPLLSVKELTEKARLYAKSAKAPSTLGAYKSDWLQFKNWCRLHRLQSLPPLRIPWRCTSRTLPQTTR